MTTLTAPISSGNRNFTPAPEGMHVARCYCVIDLGTTYSERWDKSSRRVVVMWELPNAMHEYDKDGEVVERPHVVSQFYTLSVHEKAKLRQHLESWYGKKFNDKDLYAAGGFDLSKILGRPAMLNIGHYEKKNGGGTAAGINSVNPLPQGMNCPDQVNPSVIFSLDYPDMEVFDGLSDGFKDMIRMSDEWARIKGQTDDADEGPVSVTDDDIPFSWVLPILMAGATWGLM